ncbi:MAG: hypothetical protein EOP58_01410 [Sphingomonadales bacterium]|nr:MAG: hypothetical protein EOP58_01410 [Sphingomonadales bacterium]
MKTLKIVSWNLRTFGDPLPGEAAMREIASIIVNVLGADLVVLQEVQAGANVTPDFGCPVSPSVVLGLQDLLAKLQGLEAAANWRMVCSPVNNSEASGSMRDAYAYFWKQTPSVSLLSHDDAPLQIALLQSPEILSIPGPNGGSFPGRRPGAAVFEVTTEAQASPIPINIVSIHAATPCNTVGKFKSTNGVSSGRAIFALAQLPDIGGTYRTSNGFTYKWHDGEPLPEIDTIFLGDCNYAMDASDAAGVYLNLTTNYEPCVSTLTKSVRTTYSADPTKPFGSVSSYDNIFVLKSHDDFKPSVSFDGDSGAYDFILDWAEKLGGAAEIEYFPTETAWYVCYKQGYRRQNALPGISDHLPVWASFTVDESKMGSVAIRQTSGANNNCLFHAVFGQPNNQDVYVDAQAAQRRTTFATQLQGVFGTVNFARYRQNILASMINEFQGSPNWLGLAQNLLANPNVDPGQFTEWTPMVAAYLQGIRGGRMLYVHEAEMLAMLANITINLWHVSAGVYQKLTLNPGQAETDIYHFGLHFFRYDPN